MPSYRSTSHASPSLFSSLSSFALGASIGVLAAIIYRRATSDDDRRFRDDNEPAAIKDGVLGLVGGTPLVRVRCLSESTGCEILAKAEFCNPGGSVKDRVAAAILTEASSSSSRPSSSSKKRPLLCPGGLVTEGTAGSTGIALAMLAPSFGVRAAVWMPDDAAEEKSATMEALGARVTRVRPCSIASPEHFVNLARAAAAEAQAGAEAARKSQGDDHARVDDDDESDTLSVGGGGLFADQFENAANARCHEEGTGEEIWRQTRGKIDAFVCGAGTGGTLAGVAAALKKKNRDDDKSFLSRLFSSSTPPSSPIAVVLVDPQGSSLFNAVTRGVAYSRTEAEGKRRAHQVDTVTEGVGLNRITKNFAKALPLVDGAVSCTDEEAVEMARHLLFHDGLFVGSSAAVNCVGAVKVARALLLSAKEKIKGGEEKKESNTKGSPFSSLLSLLSPPPPSSTAATAQPTRPVVVTLLCDGGGRHLSKFHSGDALRNAGVAAALGPLRSREDLRFVL